MLAERPDSRLLAGATDALVEVQRTRRSLGHVIDITGVSELRGIVERDSIITIGALATHADVLASAVCVERALPLALACREVGAPPIRSRATVVGNLVTASPANDTIVPLMALDATLELISASGSRSVPLKSFYTGLRRTALQQGEVVTGVSFSGLGQGKMGVFRKLGLRRAQAISVVSGALVLASADDGALTSAALALGCVAPTVVRLEGVERALLGARLRDVDAAQIGALAASSIAPIDDLRGSAAYRRRAVAGIVQEMVQTLAADRQRALWRGAAVTLAATPSIEPGVAQNLSSTTGETGETIATTINGRPCALAAQPPRTLLDAIREDTGLTGVKEGCGEGECGTCTVWLNGSAVMACLVPAPAAAGGEIVTVEGLARDGELHPLQTAFVRHGAVQCGFCTPGLLMAGAKLLETTPHPSESQAREAISGNICRCTGYAQIVSALRDAPDTP